jgi:hypothetical protein
MAVTRRRGWAAAAAVAALVALLPASAAAFERTWHFGADVGYATTVFPGFTAGGFGAGGYVTYGLTDAINLRVQADATIVELPDPLTSALFYQAGLGGEYVLDTIDWVVYGGALAGPVDVSIQEGGDMLQLGLIVPVGLNYQLSQRFAVGGEGQLRLFLLGPAGSPTTNLTLLGRFEVMLGD